MYRIIIAGQVPPPIGGQNVMIARIVEIFAKEPDFTVEHLPFAFTHNWSTRRRASLRKGWELLRVVGRLSRIRLHGRIDCLLFPVGGPAMTPMLRDFALVPMCRLLATNVVLHLHAAGHRKAISKLPKIVSVLTRAVYARCDAAIVPTAFCREDAETLGIRRVEVVPNPVPDRFKRSLVSRGSQDPVTAMYVGHLSNDKGTPQLLNALKEVRRDHPELHLRLLGEPLWPYTSAELQRSIEMLGLQDAVEIMGVVHGECKWQIFGAAELFIFPSVAVSESFSLVLVEAMMWGLPIVATDWRANREVMGEGGGVCFDPYPDLQRALANALMDTLDRRSLWEQWGRRNRDRYVEAFKGNERQLVSLLRCLIESR
jgi:glycosyltransferase involved in cell wall biosynthesis